MQKDKRLLIVSYSFPPANSPAAKRVYYFAKYLPENGILTTVLTAEYQLSSLGYGSSLSLDGIDFIRLPKQPHTSQATSKQIIKNSLLSRVLKHLLFPDRGIVWLFKGMNDARAFLKKNPDVEFVFASAPSFVNFIIALVLKFVFKKKLILDFRDFYFTEGLFKRIFPFNLLDKLLEWVAVRSANHLLFISNGMKDAYQKAYPFIDSKSSLIYNGVDISTVKSVHKRNSVTDKVVLFYAGSFYFNSSHPRNIFLVIDCLLNLSERGLIPDFEIHIAANLTIAEQELFNYPKYQKHILLLGLLTQNEVEQYYSKVDACLLLLGNSKQDQSALPIKVFEYLHSGLAILALTPASSEINELLRSHAQYAACYYENAIERNEAIIFNWFESILSGKASQTNSDFMQAFDRKYQTQQLATIVKKL